MVVSIEGERIASKKWRNYPCRFTRLTKRKHLKSFDFRRFVFLLSEELSET